MANPSNTAVQNLLPVQAYFNLDGSFSTFIGQGVPFYATINPFQSGLTITNSTIDSSPIGSTSPSTGVFTNITTNTGTIATQPTGATDIVNLLALQSYAAGISWKNPVTAATLTNITLSGPQTIDGKAVVAGDTVLVKNQTSSAQNGIYQVNAGAWTYATGSTTWAQYVSALVFVEYGSQAGSAWYCSAQPGGTLGVTAMTWSNFSVSSTYTAGTGLTLTGYQFSITPVGTANTYGSATQTPVFTTNASGQVTAVTNTTITPALGSITGFGTNVATFLATPTSANLAAAVTDETGSGSLVFATSPTLVTPILGTPTSGNFSTGTFTWPTFNQNTTGTASKATNLVGGAAGSLPYQSAVDTTTFLAAGTNGQVLTLASGVPSWATPTTGTVTSVGTAGTVSGITLTGGPITSTGTITLGGTLDLSAPPAIGGTTPNTITGTTITANTKFVSPYFDAANSAGGSLRNSGGTACLQWGGGGGANLTVDVSANLNGANAQIDISPTGTGHVHLNPAGTGSVEIKPTNAGVMDNMVIGGTTPLAGTFTNLRFNGTLSLAGSTGTAGYVVTSNGASAPTWQALPATGLAIVDDTTTNATRYVTFTSATSGNITTENVSSTKLQYNPSTGALSATKYFGDGSSLTGIVSGATISNDTSTASNLYPLFSSATSGTPTTIYTSNAKYLYKPSTGDLQASQVIASNGLVLNNTTVSASYTVASGNNAMSVGPMTIASGQSVTVSSGQRWVVL
jgi:hypothetical protein